MRKFTIALLILLSLFLLIGTYDEISLIFTPDYLKYNSESKENIDISDLSISSSRKDYYEYIKEYNQSFPQNVDLILDHAYLKEGQESDYKLINYEGVSNGILTDETGEVSWEFNIDQSGYYNIGATYFPYEGKSSAIERTIMINGEVPYQGAKNVVFYRTWGNEREIRQDIFGNDIRPTQIEKPRWITDTIRDPLGYVSGDYLFYFEEGINTLTFKSEREPMLIKNITIKSNVETLTYSKYNSNNINNGYKKVDGNLNLIEAENFTYSTSPTLYPINDTDPATSPDNSPKIMKLNAIGGANWGVSGDYITWNFSVEETGLYQISLKLKQSLVSGMSSGRNIYINNEILFDELKNYSFNESDNFRIQTLGTKDEAFYFMFEEGKNYEIKLETSLGLYGSIISSVEGSIDTLSRLYREIIKYTSPDPDPSRDYLLTSRIPNLVKILEEEKDNLETIREDLILISGSKSEKTGILDTMIFQLKDFLKKTSDIHKKIKPFSDNISSLGTLVVLLSSQSITLDYIVVHSEDVKLPKPRVSLFKAMFFNFRAFISTFFTDYSEIGLTNRDESLEKIEVWLNIGKDQSNILRKLIDEQFTTNYGIQVDLKLVSSAALLPATLSGNGPDIALGVDNSTPVNYALRKASADLTKFEGYEEVSKQFYESALVPFSYGDGVFALPEQQIFLMMFYRSDIFEEYGLEVPDTWDELIQLVINLQRYNFEFYLPVPTSVGVMSLPPNPIYSTMFLQNNGEFYTNGGRESGFADGLGPEVFERWTEFYTDYSFPVQADFVNRFRSGQMPIGISYYNTYNTLSVFAPEIRGKWKFDLMPGTLDENGEIRRDTVSTGTGAMILENSKKKEASWKFLQWWTSTETQVRFGREMEGILGAAARYPTANIEAMKSLPWRVEEINLLQEQWEWVRGIPEVPGSYMTGRHLDNAFRLVINERANPRETIFDYVQTINLELMKKREEFGLE